MTDIHTTSPIARLKSIDIEALPTDGGPYNRLIFEKSPYLLQHFDNPVDWYPWGEEAFDKAKQENKPVFLSIGYSTCHWCHVMAHESFENEEVAALLNESFVAIKVDREERPDIDQTYMSVCQMLTGSGGWPLTLILAPDKNPIFAATYLPPQQRADLVGLKDVLQHIRTLWDNDPYDVQMGSLQISHALKQQDQASQEPSPLNEGPLQTVINYYRLSYDADFGGFGKAPKFPTTHNLSLLLRLAHRYKIPSFGAMALETLRQLRCGGIYDQIGHGIHRYSVDNQWIVPHFEKMLYDQAMLIIAGTEAYQYSGEAIFRQLALETAGYICHDLLDPVGAFHSGEDADSEGAEGTYYVWTPKQIEQVLGKEAGDAYCRRFSINETGNFEGKSIPVIAAGKTGVEKLQVLEKTLADPAFEVARQTLLAARRQRQRPHRDDKILTAWNGLAIAALARAGAVFAQPRLIAKARGAARFILQHLRQADGRLLRRWRQREAAISGFLEDYSFLTWGLFELYQADFCPEDLKEALTLTEQMLEIFADGRNGLFDTGKDAETVLHRSLAMQDGALPSGNAIAIRNLLRLGRCCQRADLVQRDEQLLQSGIKKFRASPQYFAKH
ncbi:MAG: thioredoxin domain-containing protein, partial [Desulfuromonadaceae bacterium]